MTDHIFGFDDNLGLPSNFSQHTGLPLKSYHELKDMVEDFEKQKLSLMFIPCGTLPYLSKPYSIVAQATLGPKHENRIHVQLMTAKNLSLEQSLDNTFGRINPYCTTSYWGLLLFLMEHCPSAKTIHFKRTNGFQDLLDKTAKGKVESGMLWDQVLEKNPSMSQNLKSLGELCNLPTPIIVANTAISESLKDSLTHFQFEEKNGFFNGFKTPDLKLIDDFLHHMKQAQEHFLIKEI